MNPVVEVNIKEYLTGLAEQLKVLAKAGGDIRYEVAAVARQVGILANNIKEEK